MFIWLTLSNFIVWMRLFQWFLIIGLRWALILGVSLLSYKDILIFIMSFKFDSTQFGKIYQSQFVRWSWLVSSKCFFILLLILFLYIVLFSFFCIWRVFSFLYNLRYWCFLIHNSMTNRKMLNKFLQFLISSWKNLLYKQRIFKINIFHFLSLWNCIFCVIIMDQFILKCLMSFFIFYLRTTGTIF